MINKLFKRLSKRHLAIFFVLFCGIIIGSFGVLEIRTIHADITIDPGNVDKVNPMAPTAAPTPQTQEKTNTEVTNTPVTAESSPTAVPTTPQTVSNNTGVVSMPTGTPSPCH